MAKGKHSTALFEVIHSANRPERVAQSLRTPKWWFKGRQGVPASPQEELSFDQAEPMPAAAESNPAQRAESSEPATPRSVRRLGRGRSSAVHFDFNRERQEITVRLRYTTALVSGFAMFMLIALSYVVGRHIGRGPQSASAADSSDIPHLMQQPPQAGVTAVSRQRQSTSQGGTPTTAQPTTPTQPRHAIDSSPHSVKPRQAAVTSLVPASAETGMPRAVGLNYVIIGTYPPEMRQNAESARDYFTRNGIPCTIERTEYVRNPNWVCLVGTAGFTKVSAPDFEDYTANIRELAAKMTSSRFDRPDPHGYKWKGTETP